MEFDIHEHHMTGNFGIDNLFPHVTPTYDIHKPE
jgi:hypothetical protein